MTATSDDRQLISRIAARDQSALRMFYARHQVRVFRFLIRKVRSEAQAEELTNEVFMEVWRNAASYEGRSAATTWVLSIARFRAASLMRKRTEESWNEDDALQLADDGDDPEVATQKLDKGQMLRRCMEQLSEDHREIIDLVYYHELSIAEASETIGIPEATVKTRMFYARKKLSELLKAAGVDRGWP